MSSCHWASRCSTLRGRKREREKCEVRGTRAIAHPERMPLSLLRTESAVGIRSSSADLSFVAVDPSTPSPRRATEAAPGRCDRAEHVRAGAEVAMEMGRQWRTTRRRCGGRREDISGRGGSGGGGGGSGVIGGIDRGGLLCLLHHRLRLDEVLGFLRLSGSVRVLRVLARVRKLPVHLSEIYRQRRDVVLPQDWLLDRLRRVDRVPLERRIGDQRPWRWRDALRVDRRSRRRSSGGGGGGTIVAHLRTTARTAPLSGSRRRWRRRR